jgi:hypothetical protein
MSALRQILDNKGKMDETKIPSVLKGYKSKIKDSHKDLSLKNKNIGDALIEQHSLAAYYDEIKAELYTFRSHLEILMKKRAGEVNRMFKENSNFDHSDRSIDKLIPTDETYIKYSRIYVEVDELYNKVRYICKQFEQRAYTLTNIKEVLKYELRDITLTKEYD